jgi:hypothetical protein
MIGGGGVFVSISEESADALGHFYIQREPKARGFLNAFTLLCFYSNVLTSGCVN